MLAGRNDALALAGVSSGLMSSLPWVASNPALALPALGAAGLGASWMLYKNLMRWDDRIDTESRSDFTLPSDLPLPLSMGEGGIRMGYTKDGHQPIDIDNDLLARHMCIIGSTGVGKTVLGENMLWQQMVRGGGLLFVDAKLDKDTRDKLAWMAALCGRSDDFLVLNTADPSNSNTYNPILRGEGDEVSSRLLNLLPITEGNPGADHFKQQANIAVTNVVNALNSANMRYHFGDLTVLLQSPKAMEALLREARAVGGEDSPEARAFDIFLDQYRNIGKGGESTLDMKRIKETFGGIAGRIALFAQGGFAKTFCTYTPEIDLTDAMLNNKMVYVMLPTMGKDAAALNLGKMIISDLRTAVANLQDLPKYKRPDPPFLCFLDEFGSYVVSASATLLEQARSAQVSMVVAFQSTANLKTVGPDFADKVLQNTWTKVFFRFGNKDDADYGSEIIGKSIKYAQTLSTGESESASSPLTAFSPVIQESGGGSASEGWRETETFRVTPDQLRSINKGEAVIYALSRMYHVRVPMLYGPRKLPPFRASKVDYKIPRTERPCNFEKDYKQFMSIGQIKDD